MDWELINENFEKLDNMTLCIESGEKTAAYSGGVTGNATWRYKKYSDGSVELYTGIEFKSLKCSAGSSIPYCSENVKVSFPITLTSIDNAQLHMASDTVGWVSNITGKNILDYIMFKVASMKNESSYVYKQIFINVKGRWK